MRRRKHPLPGDTVKLKEEFDGFKYGLVIEVVSEFPDGIPRQVALVPFNSNGSFREIVELQNHITPEAVDFHVNELIIVNKREGSYDEENIDVEEELDLGIY